MAEAAPVDSETGKHTRSQDLPESKKDIGPSLVETTIPIPDFLSTDWSYDECLAGVSSPDVDTVFGVEKSDSSTQYDYQFATHGIFSAILSFWDTWSGNAVTSYAWQKEDFTCHPYSIQISSAAFLSSPEA
jgi:hypothetical protein